MPLHIGAPLFPNIDQLDLNGPFEVLANLPDATFHLYSHNGAPVRDARGLILTPNASLADAPQLDVLVIPGGSGTLQMMEDAEMLAFLRRQAKSARYVLSVCTGAMLAGAAGFLVGKRATTHWNSHHLLSHFGAIPVNERYVVEGNLITCAGVSAGIDGALKLAALLTDVETAQGIQLYIQYAPEPPFNAGSIETAPASVSAKALEKAATITAARLAIAQRIGPALPH